MTTLEQVAEASKTHFKIDPFTHITGAQWYICKLTDSSGITVSILDGIHRRIVLGCAPTGEQARAEYVAQITGKTLSISQFFDTRTYQVPNDLIP